LVQRWRSASGATDGNRDGKIVHQRVGRNSCVSHGGVPGSGKRNQVKLGDRRGRHCGACRNLRCRAKIRIGTEACQSAGRYCSPPMNYKPSIGQGVISSVHKRAAAVAPARLKSPSSGFTAGGMRVSHADSRRASRRNAKMAYAGRSCYGASRRSLQSASRGITVIEAAALSQSCIGVAGNYGCGDFEGVAIVNEICLLRSARSLQQLCVTGGSDGGNRNGNDDLDKQPSASSG